MSRMPYGMFPVVIGYNGLVENASMKIWQSMLAYMGSTPGTFKNLKWLAISAPVVSCVLGHSQVEAGHESWDLD